MIPRYIAAKLLKQKEENERSEDVVMNGTIMDGGARSSRTVAEVFSDFKGRRAGLITALTNEFELFFSKCDPENVNLCLYGHPNGQWDVDLPVEELPPELPEPVLGINFARDGMQKNDWACLVAVHCHTWLLSVAFYFGARYGFDKSDRKRLFKMINDLPTIPEIVMEVAKNKVKDEPSGNQNSNNNESLFNSNVGNLAKQMMSRPLKDDDDEDEDKEEDEEEEEEHGKTLCKACGEKYSKSEFWISCDMCEISFHGNRVKIFPARAVHIKQYKCSNCGIQVKQMKSLPIKDDNEEEQEQEQEQEKHGEILCRACGDKYSKSEFWISREMCEVSFHGNRVKISPARAVHIKQYKCPNCNNKGSRP